MLRGCPMLELRLVMVCKSGIECWNCTCRNHSRLLNSVPKWVSNVPMYIHMVRICNIQFTNTNDSVDISSTASYWVAFHTKGMPQWCMRLKPNTQRDQKRRLKARSRCRLMFLHLSSEQGLLVICCIYGIMLPSLI